MLHSPTSISSNISDDIPDENPWAEVNYGAEGQENAQEATPKPATQRAPGRPKLPGRKRSQTIGHPLWSPEVLMQDGEGSTQGQGSSLEVYITRPSHRRSRASEEAIPNGLTINMDIDQEMSETNPAEKEKEVIVHEVKPGDSLAGVALKYSVSMAAIRSANKLWANDSIHLRKQLYIPFDSIKAQPTLSRSSARSSESGDVSRPLRDRTRRTASEWDAYEPSHNVRRVPVSELSFFPPPSNPIPRQTVVHSVPPSTSNSPPFITFGRSSLTNLLNGAKEEIMSRLSLDSSRDASEVGEDQGVELDEAPWRKKDRPHSGETHRTFRTSPPKARPERSLGALFDRPVTPPTKIIRTIQLQPSPSMVIPARSSVAEKLPPSTP